MPPPESRHHLPCAHGARRGFNRPHHHRQALISLLHRVIAPHILNKKLQFPKDKFAHVSKDCISFIQECLKKEPMLRLGYKDARELMVHPWFQEFGKHGWNALERKLIRPPYVPTDVNPEKIPIKEPKDGELALPPDVHDYEIDSIFADFNATSKMGTP